MQAIKAISVLAVVALAAGCNQEGRDKLGEHVVAAAVDEFTKRHPIPNPDEEVRRQLTEGLGPFLIPSLIGFAAPPGGPLCLLGADALYQCLGADITDPRVTAPPFGLGLFAPAQRP